jgi:DinB family protein
MSTDRTDAAPAWSRQLTAELLAADQRAIALARGLSVEQLNWKPRPESWSVGQCLEHLCLTGEVYLAPIAQALNNQQRSPVETITPGWFGAWFIRSYIAPSPVTRKAAAPKNIRPVLSTVEPSVLDRFLAANREVRALIERARPYDVNRIRFVNPFIGIIRFTVGTGFEIIAKHEDRHLLQAERVWQSWAQANGR